MGDDAFARSCRDTARQLRAMPAGLRYALEQHVLTDVAQPLAARVAASYRGPWGQALATSTEAAEVDGWPSVVVTGDHPVVSGGASALDLVYGAQFGPVAGNARVSRRTRKSGTVTYQVRTGRQFAGKARDTINPAIDQAMPWVLEQVGDIVDDVLTEVARG